MDPRRLAPLVFIALLWVEFLLDGPFSLVAAILKLVTEGNSHAKQAVWLASFSAFWVLSAYGRSHLAFLETHRKHLKGAFFLLALLGFFSGIALQVFVQSSLGAGPSSYISLVTDCGSSVCWEASFFQHIHLLKSSIYFFEKTTGLFLPANSDDGKPVFDMMASPALNLSGWVPPLALALLAAIFLAGFLSALAYPGWEGFWLFLGASISTLSILDGGFFSLAGMAAFSVLLLILSKSIPLGRFDVLKPFAVLGIVLFVARIPEQFMGTGLYFREWLLAPVLLCTAFALAENRKSNGVRFAFFALLFAASLAFVFSDVVRYWQGESSEPGRYLVYGVPNSVTDAQLLNASQDPFPGTHLSAANKTLVGRYGWYALLDSTQPVNPAQFAQQLRQLLAPKGYLLVEPAPRVTRKVSASVVWITTPVPLGETASFHEVTQLGGGLYSALDGTSSLYPSQLALELGSFIHAQGGRAIVITPIQ